MMLPLFCIGLILQLYVPCFNVNKNIIVKSQWGGVANRKEVKSSAFLLRRQLFKLKKFRVHSSDHGEGKPSIDVEQNGAKNTLREFYHRNCTRLRKTFELIRSGLITIQDNLLSNSLASQLAISVSFFLLHFYMLSRHFLILFPYQLIPNHSNILMSLDMNNTLFFLMSIFFFKRFKGHFHSFKERLQLNRFTIKLQEHKRKNILSISFFLIASYVLSGYVSIYTERILTLWKLFSRPLSDNVVKSLQILTGHFIWVACSIVVFKNLLYPYFVNNESNLNLRHRDSWCFQVIYGYVFSHFVFNIVDLLNNFIINRFMGEAQDEAYVDNSIDDIVSGREFVSTLLCIISPCFSAPFFEEFIYRFFVLKSLNLFMHIHYAVTFSSLFFAIHHLNIFNLLPLFFLSFLWSYIYIYTDNILVTMLIHSFWNIYVFLSSLYS
ncbi:hypothetical protein C922_01571 [Plasmodium inui San Antonio 1]|uniref:CAAX prenyl protease 2/Lysostaphin resistance protein A-like domain-containing protein n=1 Tax=Plasmodium inui San Antonio 1 TaxID=1237626 RepID=W7AG08_9APIC|nr:hypothetical protein C922_01571 [Plasmodium inui San Antonio 1]EUD67959.1 hypothetical protein C922_01571 [Plasmodium inui San Antonio 1]